MKKLFYKITVLVLGVFLMHSCEESDATVDFVTDNVTRGAILKTIEVKSPVIDINDIANSAFAVEVEYRDNEGNSLLGSVDVYASFIDNTDDGEDNSKPEVFTINIPSSEFAIDDTFGNPRADLLIPASETFTSLGLSPDQLNGGDVVFYRLVLKLTDGREFTNNASGNVSGGSFFSSPFQYGATLVCLFDAPDFFSGKYQITQLSGTDPFYGAETFGSQVVEVTANGVERSFPFLFYPDNFQAAYNMSLNLVCGEIIVLGSGGLGCGAGIGQTTGSKPSFFDEDLEDDDEIIINITDFDPDGDCGTGPNQIVISMTKILD